MHLKQVSKLLSYIMLFLAIIMLLPAAVGIIYREPEAVKAFCFTSLGMAVLSIIGIVLLKKEDIFVFTQNDGFLFTTLTWVAATAFGAIPLVLSGNLTHYSSAFFEIMSGFTTTGASRISDVEGCFKAVLFWRALTNWLGGMGIVVLFVALLPALGSGGGSFNLIGAETVGPVKGKLTPNTKSTAIVLWAIYVGVTILQIVLLLFGNISFFDAMTIAFSTVSTAGFSVKNASIGAYSSAYIDVIVTIFMVIAAINFSLYYKAFTGRLREIKDDTELKWLLSIVCCSSITGAVYLTAKHIYPSFGSSLRYMAFHIASVISTTGFSNASFLDWPVFCVMLVILMMFIGGCAGSTGGGIKVVRLIVILKSGVNNLRKKIHPNGVFTLRLNKNTIIDDDTQSNILSFFGIYIITWLIGTVVISLSGASITDCLSSSILTLGNIGLGFGKQSFADYPLWTDWVFSFLMLAGRLELFTVYVLFTKTFWKR